MPQFYIIRSFPFITFSVYTCFPFGAFLVQMPLPLFFWVLFSPFTIAIWFQFHFNSMKTWYNLIRTFFRLKWTVTMYNNNKIINEKLFWHMNATRVRSLIAFKVIWCTWRTVHQRCRTHSIGPKQSMLKPLKTHLNTCSMYFCSNFHKFRHYNRLHLALTAQLAVS